MDKEKLARQADKLAIVWYYLGSEGVLVTSEIVALMAERVVAGAEGVEVALHLLGLTARAAVLEPNSHLARVEAQVASDAGLALRVQLVVRLEAPLQRAHLIRRQAPLLLPQTTAPADELVLIVVVVLLLLLVVHGGHHVLRHGAVDVEPLPLHVPGAVF
jgi:hypothetical protein